MTTRHFAVALALGGLSTLPGCTTEEPFVADEAGAWDEDAIEDTVEFRVAFPAGYGRYCSIQWPDGTWAVGFGTSDPCSDLEQSEPSGFTVERAGRYDLTGLNNVVMRCAQTVWWGRVEDDAPLIMAEGYAHEHNLTHCTMTVAPARLPVFDSPFNLSDQAGAARNGFDFMYDMESVDVAEYGQPSAISSVIDFLGRDQTGIAGDNHYGIDYGLPAGKPIYAVADGRVIMSHARDVDVTPCCQVVKGEQEEMLIRHKFADGRSDRYAESFVTYYAHFSKRLVNEGDWVTQGQLIGYAGETGCAYDVHLHMGVKRLSNTASELYDNDFTPIEPDAADCSAEDNSVANIDPFGWWPQQLGFDPWGWTFHNQGALSIDLWREGQKPLRE